MKLLLVCLLFLFVSFFVAPDNLLAQTKTSQPTSEQSLQELVSEVRKLRSTLQRINSAMYKGQVMLERLKWQQEQVFRLSRELADARENLSEIRSQQNRVRDALKSAEAGEETGTRKPDEVADMKAHLASLNERENRLAMRETQLANDLELERAKVIQLDQRLNALEVELAPNKP